MNTRHAKKAFNELNAKYFFDVLPMPRFEKFEGSKHGFSFSVHGAYENYTIYYHRKLKGALFRGTIAHEMIHEFQDYSGFYSSDHGKEFCDIAALMEKDGLIIR